MSKESLFKYLFGVIYVVVLIIAIAFLEWWILILWLGLGFTFLLAYLLEEYVHVRVQEMEVAVIFKRRTEEFHRFIDRPGEHIINPILYYHKGTIPVGIHGVEVTSENARTKDGVPISVRWLLIYRPHPMGLPANYRVSMSRALLGSIEGMAKNHGNNIMRLVIERHPITDFYNQNEIQKNLEAEFKQALKERLEEQVTGHEVYRVMIREIKIPESVQHALIEEGERRIQLETLHKIHEVVNQFGPEDFRNLTELERMWTMMGTDSGNQVYMVTSMMQLLERMRANMEKGNGATKSRTDHSTEDSSTTH